MNFLWMKTMPRSYQVPHSVVSILSLSVLLHYCTGHPISWI
uniref:Uncharacterized protein n=1 Tax=Arundo donax TaxID=35708 RepID=A0A0A9GRH4_ARUDO